MADIKKFEIGKVYSCRSFCDYNTIFSWKVIKRTDKTITIKDTLLKTSCRRKIYVYNGVEACMVGRYANAPVLLADKI